MADWWESAPVVEQQAGGDSWYSAAPVVGQEQAAQPELTTGQAAAKAVYDRLRYMNDVMSFGAYDKLQALAKSYTQGGSYQDQLAKERAATQASTGGLGTAEKIGYGVLASVPLAAAGGVGGLATRAAGLGAPAMAPTVGGRIGAGIAEGAAQGALEAVGRDQNVTSDALTGAAIGGAIPLAAATAGRIISPIANQLTRPQQQLVKEAEARGLELTPAQATGSRRAAFFESQLRDLPGGAASPRPQQQEQLQRAILNESGIVGDTLTPDAIASGFKREGSNIERALAGKNIVLDQKFESKINNVINNYTDRLDANVSGIFTSVAKDLSSKVPSAMSKLAGAQSSIPGKQAGNIRSDIANLERSYKDNPQLRSALGGLREALDDAIERSLTGAEREAIKEARGKYKNLYRLDEIVSRAGGQAESGNIPFVQLNNLLKQKSGSVSRGIQSATPEFKKLAQIGSQFFREPPSSGTSQRAFYTGLLGGGGAGLGVGGLTGAAAALATGVGMPYLTNIAYNSRAGQAWLKNQLGRPLERVGPEAQSALTGSGLGLLGQ
jgi:hypothetical protein